MILLIFKIVLKILLTFIGICAVYLIAAFTVPYITVNNSFVNKKDGIKIFIASNGDHTDIVVPVKNNLKNWAREFPRENFDVKDTFAYNHIGFGWGDKGFYLNTPTWADLKFSTAFKAVFGMGGTAMHVTYLKEQTPEPEKCVELLIDETQYKILIHLIENSFEKKNDAVIKINNPGYGAFDRFYEANGTYTALKTCNNWTNGCLAKTGVKVALWSPFSQPLLRSLKQE